MGDYIGPPWVNPGSKKETKRPGQPRKVMPPGCAGVGGRVQNNLYATKVNQIQLHTLLNTSSNLERNESRG